MARERGASVRMEPIATLPVFFKLAGKRAVLAGGTDPAAWKAELLSAAGAMVEIFAPDPSAAVMAVAADPPAGPITLTRREWRPTDLAGAAIALGALEDDAEAALFQTAARAAGVPVNVIDKPAFCDFQFGTIVSRSPLMVGISTDGAAPVFGQAIRTRIEALLPQTFRAWAAAARDWRPTVQAMDLDFRARRRFWDMFAALAYSASDRHPTETDLEACRRAVLDRVSAPTASVTLVGAGPGVPGAVTLDAVRSLQDADVVFHDPDVSPLVVNYARREAEKVALGNESEDALALIAAMHSHGRKIVWLGSGSPGGCRRTAHREALLTAAGIGVATVEGLGPCSACGRTCPHWPTTVGAPS